MQQTFRIHTEFITLGQLLKATDTVGSGSEVKDFLDATAVRVNGNLDNRRGRKLRPGDQVQIGRTKTILIENVLENGEPGLPSP